MTSLNQDCHARALHNGDERGFEFFFREYYPALCFYAGRYVYDRLLAEDLVTDAFVKLWQRRSLFDQPVLVRSYLYASVRNASINEFRHREVEKEYAENYRYMFKEEIDNTIIEQMIEKEILQSVYASIRDLPRQCRKIISSLYRDGKNFREVAQEMDLSVNTIKNQKARGILLVRKKLGLAV